MTLAEIKKLQEAARRKRVAEEALRAEGGADSTGAMDLPGVRSGGSVAAMSPEEKKAYFDKMREAAE